MTKENSNLWEFPSDGLLDPIWNGGIGCNDLEEKKAVIKKMLKDENIDLEIVDVITGFTYTQFTLKTGSTTSLSKLQGLHDRLTLALNSPNGSIRIVPSRDSSSKIFIEVPNDMRGIVKLKPLLESKLTVTMGLDVYGRPYRYDLARMAHLLIASTTGSGKSQLIHNILFSIFYRATPNEVKMILIDPKRVEFAPYRDIPYLLTPVITDVNDAETAFSWVVEELDRRFKLLEKNTVRNVNEYNNKVGTLELPYLIIAVDEFGELMVNNPAGMEKNIIRVAQVAKYSGIHMVLATSRPSLNTYTGVIKANIPSRAAFNTASAVDSKVIIDQPGAEKLLGRGDMLFSPPDQVKPIRLQVPFISDNEIQRMVDYLKKCGIPEYTHI